MKAVILAGGKGTRLAEETVTKPKPMIEIGGHPILWHIMKIYSHAGINDFVVCLGHKGYLIKEYFSNYFLHQSDVTFDIANNSAEIHDNKSEPWKVTLVDTGTETMTGGRLKRVASYLEGDADFCMTYGDGVADVDIGQLIDFHRQHSGQATVTAVRPPARFGALEFSENNRVEGFEEKPVSESGYINGGFFVLDTEVLSLIEGDATVWEREPMEKLSEGQLLYGFRHEGFWQPMDTLREKNLLERLWGSGRAPWKTW